MILVDKIAIISKKNEVGIGFDALEDVLEDYLTFFQGGCVGGHQDAAQIAVHGFGTIEYKGGVVFFPVHDVEAVCLLDQGFVVDVGFVLLIEEVVEGIEVLVWNEGVFANLTTDGEGAFWIGELDEDGEVEELYDNCFSE